MILHDENHPWLSISIFPLVISCFYLFIDKVSAVGLCLCCAKLLDQFCGFNSIFTALIIGKYIEIVLMKPP